MKQVLVCLCLVAAGADVDVGYDAKTKIRSAQNAAMAWLARQNAHASSTRVYSDSDPTAVAAKGAAPRGTSSAAVASTPRLGVGPLVGGWARATHFRATKQFRRVRDLVISTP